MEKAEKFYRSGLDLVGLDEWLIGSMGKDRLGGN